MIKPSPSSYFQSLADELTSQSSRVRQLIGDAHWGQDGRHKEVLLQNLVRRHCPSTVLVSTGFIVSPNTSEVRSKEQDLLVIDTSNEAPLFHQGDLAIVFPHTVIAAISIKTTMSDATLKSVVEGLQTVREVARESNCEQQRIWCGGFFYTVTEPWLTDPAEVYQSLKKHTLANPAKPAIVDSGFPNVLGLDALADANHLSFIVDYERSGETHSAKIRGYSCKGIATAVFLSCLVEHIALRLSGKHSTFSDFLSDLSIPMVNPPTWPLSS